MSRWLQTAFFAALIRPVLLLVLGVNIRNRDRFPKDGPAIILANHNSHLDTVSLMAMFPLSHLHRIRPVAAEDYFDQGGPFAWFARNVIRILPINRQGGQENPLAVAEEALDRGEILILFPEGTRGEPEKLAAFKKGAAHLAKARPDVPVTPVFLHGFGKALPKGTILFVPFNCDVFVDDSFTSDGTIDGFMATLDARMTALAAEGRFSPWT